MREKTAPYALCKCIPILWIACLTPLASAQKGDTNLIGSEFIPPPDFTSPSTPTTPLSAPNPRPSGAGGGGGAGIGSGLPLFGNALSGAGGGRGGSRSARKNSQAQASPTGDSTDLPPLNRAMPPSCNGKPAGPAPNFVDSGATSILRCNPTLLMQNTTDRLNIDPKFFSLDSAYKMMCERDPLNMDEINKAFSKLKQGLATQVAAHNGDDTPGRLIQNFNNCLTEAKRLRDQCAPMESNPNARFVFYHRQTGNDTGQDKKQHAKDEDDGDFFVIEYPARPRPIDKTSEEYGAPRIYSQSESGRQHETSTAAEMVMTLTDGHVPLCQLRHDSRLMNAIELVANPKKNDPGAKEIPAPGASSIFSESDGGVVASTTPAAAQPDPISEKTTPPQAAPQSGTTSFRHHRATGVTP